MEGNCLYQHHSNFKLHCHNKENLRFNIFTICKHKNSILEIGFNGGSLLYIILYFCICILKIIVIKYLHHYLNNN